MSDATGNPYKVTMSPGTVFLGDIVTFTITIQNTSTPQDPSKAELKGQAVLLIPAGDKDTDLTQMTGQLPTGPAPRGWSIDVMSNNQVQITPDPGTTLPPGNQVQFTLTKMPITDRETATGPAVIQTLNALDGGSGEILPEPVIQKVKADKPKVVFIDADPITVGATEPVTLTWRAIGAAKVVVTGGLIPAPGHESGCASVVKCEGSTMTLPNQTVPSTTFQAIAQLDSGEKSPAKQVEVFLAKPRITDFTVPPGPLSLTDAEGKAATFHLSWKTEYTASATLNDGVSEKKVAVQEKSYAVTPATGALKGLNADSIVYTLTADGFDTPKVVPKVMSFSNFVLQYFKYTTLDFLDDKDSPIVSKVTGSTGALPSFKPPNATLHVTGPGGPKTYGLGKSLPDIQIMYFAADPPALDAAGDVTLTWVTNNATSAGLAPKIGAVPVSDNFSVITKKIQVTGTTEFVLTANNGSNETIGSTLTVTVGGS